MEMSLNHYLPIIINALKGIDVYKIVLFGSLSERNEHKDSDIDLAVILNSFEIPQNYRERIKNKLLVRNAILDISYEVPIDLVVYTRTEYEKSCEVNHPFIREIEKGKVLYETTR